jgi:signal transduction histidine kinase
LEQKDENIKVYLTNVVHDLRSPVASINMISELLEEDLECNDPIHSELVSSIKKSSKMMLDRICCMLDNAAVEQQSVLNDMIYDNPYSIIDNAVKKHHVLAIDKDIDIELVVDKELPSVNYNKEALDSVFSNLLSNAIKYSNKNTKITIQSIIRKGKLVLSIKDQGLGMSKDDLKLIFGRFTKLSARPTGNEDSSGVGLSIVKNLVEKMYGSVNVFSEGKGKGSTFVVSLSTKAHVCQQIA